MHVTDHLALCRMIVRRTIDCLATCGTLHRPARVTDCQAICGEGGSWYCAVAGLRHSPAPDSSLQCRLDLPEAHFDVVRVGLLAPGVSPSRACRRLAGVKVVLTWKARVVAFQYFEPGDTVGYGMRWRAERPSRIGLVPLGYGDRYPRRRRLCSESLFKSRSSFLDGSRPPIHAASALRVPIRGHPLD